MAVPYPFLLGIAALSGAMVTGPALRARGVARPLNIFGSPANSPTHPGDPRASRGAQAQVRKEALSTALAALLVETDKPEKKSPLEASDIVSPRLNSVQVHELAGRCASRTPISVIASLVAIESAGHPLVLATNGLHRVRYFPASREAAAMQLAELEAQGASVDVGLMQINTATLKRLHMPASVALDACRNVAIGAKVFDQSYAIAFGRRRATLPLLSAYSGYNTGDPERGLRNGYADQAAGHLRTTAQPSTTG